MNWDAYVADWSAPPLDNVGYVPSIELLERTDDELRAIATEMRHVRYAGERNVGGRWRDVLGLDTTTDKLVLDYGCGNGIESLEYARAGNRVIVADIASVNLILATRVFVVHDLVDRLHDALVVRGPLPLDDDSIDVIHCSGVLHHIAQPRPVIEDFYRLLAPDGELRLMLYSDRGWRVATGTEPPDDVTTHPLFERFVRYFDDVGNFADWYDETRLATRFGDLFHVERFTYLSAHDRNAGAVLRPR